MQDRGGEGAGEDQADRGDEQHRVGEDMARGPLAALVEALEEQLLHAEPADRDGELDRGDGERVGAEQFGAVELAGDDQEDEPRAQPNAEPRHRGRGAAHDHPPRFGHSCRVPSSPAGRLAGAPPRSTPVG